MGKRKLRARHVLRFISIGVMVVVLVAIGISFMTRSKRQMKVPEIDAELEVQKIDKKEGLEVRGMKGEKEVTNIRADKHYIGEDGLYHMEGNVRISLPERIEGEDVVIRGDRISHNADWSYFWLQGKGTVEFKDLVLRSPYLEFDREKDVLKTDQTIEFTSQTISGSSRVCDYYLGQKRAELRQDVHLKLVPSERAAVPVEVDTQYFEYYFGKGRGKAEGGVELIHGESRATADLLELELAASRQKIKSLFLQGEVRILLVGEFREMSYSEQTVLALHGNRCRMEADEVLIKGFVALPQVQRLEATGGCLFRFVSEEESFTQIEGGRISFDLTQGGKLKSLIVNGKAKISEKNEDKGSPRYIEGNRMQVQGDEKLLIVEGNNDSRARMWSKDSEITAQELRLFLENNDLEARKEMNAIIYPEAKAQDSFGIFRGESPVFVSAMDMGYSENRKRYHFSGGTKIWQTKETIKAQEISLSAETGAFRAQGNIESILPFRPGGEKEEQSVRIESSAMEYDPEKRIITYRDRENVILKTRDVTLNTRLMTVVLDKESGEMTHILARGNVVVTQKTYEGHGEEARFDVQEEVITVSENPVLVDKDKGKTEGGKLTFYMADGRIEVENKDRERSITVIKF